MQRPYIPVRLSLGEFRVGAMVSGAECRIPWSPSVVPMLQSSSGHWKQSPDWYGISFHTWGNEPLR